MPSILKLGNTINSIGGDSFADLYSVLLDGTDERIDIDGVQSALSSTSTGTWSIWYKPVDGTPVGTENLISFADTNADTFITLRILAAGTCNVRVKKAGTNQVVVTTDAAAFSSGVWTHVAVVADGVAAPLIYIDSVAVAQTVSVTTDVNAWFNTSGMSGIDNGRIGAENINSGDAQYTNANINDVLFTSDAKTLSEIQDIYHSGKPKNERSISNGVSYFRFDGDLVSVCKDHIGTNNGTYVNVEQADIELDTP